MLGRAESKMVIYTVNGSQGQFIAAFTALGDARFFAKEFSTLNPRSSIQIVRALGGLVIEVYQGGRQLKVKGF